MTKKARSAFVVSGGFFTKQLKGGVSEKEDKQSPQSRECGLVTGRGSFKMVSSKKGNKKMTGHRSALNGVVGKERDRAQKCWDGGDVC